MTALILIQEQQKYLNAPNLEGIIMKIKDVIGEVFNSTPAKINWSKSSSEWRGGFDIDSLPFALYIVKDSSISSLFPSMDENQEGWEIAFGVDDLKLTNVLKKTNSSTLEKIKGKNLKDTHSILGTGNQGKVFSTVLSAIKEFVKNIKPEYIYFTASEPSRIKLYKRILKPLSHQLGMKIVPNNYGGHFVLKK